MNLFSPSVFLSWISMMSYPSFAKGRDRELYFPSYYFFAKQRLMNHKIKNVSVKNLDECEYRCYMNDACVSLNIKNPVGGTHDCELNNSTHIEHDGHLVPDQFYYYRGAKNNCGKSGRPTCKNNSTCQSGFTDKGYRCVCTSGYKGKHCGKDIDECERGSHRCHINATCINTKGSYNCSCSKGYTGDGYNCTDVDECISVNCSAKATCRNTPGSYSCLCDAAYFGDGKICYSEFCRQSHQILADKGRKETFVTVSPESDRHLKDVWCRFKGAAGTKMATKCPELNRCNAQFPGWMKGAHPKVADGIVSREVCFRKGTCCKESTTIDVTNCGSYYIYKLSGTPSGSMRYCGTD